MAEKNATVLIPCFNGSVTLGRVLDAVASQRIRDRLHVLVVDNGSTDGSIEIAKEGADQVAVEPQRGSFRARNLGLALASTPFLITLDADCEPVDGDWAASHIAALENGGGNLFGSVGKIHPAPSDDWWALRADTTPHPAFAEGLPLYANGGNACYWTELVRRLGGFPPYRADDSALGRLAAKERLTYVFTPAAAVYHRNPEGWRGYYRYMEKVGEYVGEAYGPPESAVGFTLETARRFAGAGRHVIHGDVREAVAGWLRVAGQVRGARRAWRSAAPTSR